MKKYPNLTKYEAFNKRIIKFHRCTLGLLVRINPLLEREIYRFKRILFKIKMIIKKILRKIKNLIKRILR